MELIVTGNTVREPRVARGLSQAQLAASMVVFRQTINSIEVCRYMPSLTLAVALARLFGSTVEKVFHVEEQ
jgi:putative transcriptional regulator